LPAPNLESTKYRILIVDDDPMVRNLVATILSTKGHQCDQAGDGEEGLQKAEKIRYDAYILDVVMPKVDGITLTRELIKRFPNAPIIVMTGFSGFDYRKNPIDQEAILAGASDFISKPFSTVEFAARFTKMMVQNQALLQIKARQAELEKASAEMIAAIQKESSAKIAALRKELGDGKSAEALSGPVVEEEPGEKGPEEETVRVGTAGTAEEEESPALLAYFQQVGQKVKDAWNLPESLKKKRGLESVVVVEVSREGKTRKMWFEERSQDSLYDEYALRAIKNAQPFPPVPDTVPGSTLEITLGFKRAD
jgi:TonB family protein